MNLIQSLPKYDLANTLEVIERHKAGETDIILQYDFLDAMCYDEYFVPASEMLKSEHDRKLITLFRVEDSCKIIRQERCKEALNTCPYKDPQKFILDTLRYDLNELSYVLKYGMCWDEKPDSISYEDTLSASCFMMAHYDYLFVQNYEKRTVEKYSIYEVALIAFYSDIVVTKRESTSNKALLNTFGWTSNEALYNDFITCSSRQNRIGDNGTKIKNNNQLKRLSKVRDYFLSNNQHAYAHKVSCEIEKLLSVIVN